MIDVRVWLLHLTVCKNELRSGSFINVMKKRVYKLYMYICIKKIWLEITYNGWYATKQIQLEVDL